MEFFEGPWKIHSPDIILNKGERIDTHEHKQDHLMTVLSGRARVERSYAPHSVLDSRDLDIRHRFLNIPAGEPHGFVAEEDNTVIACLFPKKEGTELSDPIYID